MVDGVLGQHALLHVVVVLKPAHVHALHHPMVVPHARLHPFKPAVLVHVLNHVQLAAIH